MKCQGRKIQIQESLRSDPLFVVSFLVLGLGLTGCGPGFEAVKQAEIAAAHSVDEEEHAGLNWREVGEGETQPGQGYVSVGEGRSVRQAGDQIVRFDIGARYDAVFKPASQAVRLLRQVPCFSDEKVLSESDPSAYADGEIACGKVIDANWKHLTTFSVPEIKSSSGGTDFTLRAVDLPVHIGRNTRQGLYSESTLDQMGETTLVSSAKVGEDVSLRYRPDGNGAFVDLCLNLPGGEITIPKRSIETKVKKKVLFTKISLSSDFDVWMGKASFDYVRTCMTTRLSLDPTSLEPKAELVAVEYPKTNQPKFEGMQIKIKDFWTKLIDSVLRVFRVNLREQVVKAAQGKFKDLADSEIEDGSWLMRVQKDMLSDKLVTSIDSSVQAPLQSEGISTSADALRSRLTRLCSSIRALKTLEESKGGFNEVCEQFVADIDIRLNPFIRSEELAELGCYEHFGNIHTSRGTDGKAKWWAKKCKFMMGVEIRLPANYVAFKKEIKDYLASVEAGLPVPSDIEDILEEKGLDESALPKLIEDLESRGVRAPTLEDLRRELPAIL